MKTHKKLWWLQCIMWWYTRTNHAWIACTVPRCEGAKEGSSRSGLIASQASSKTEKNNYFGPFVARVDCVGRYCVLWWTEIQIHTLICVCDVMCGVFLMLMCIKCECMMLEPVYNRFFFLCVQFFISTVSCTVWLTLWWTEIRIHT